MTDHEHSHVTMGCASVDLCGPDVVRVEIDWDLAVQEQRRICAAVGAEWSPVSAERRVAVAEDLRHDLVPVNGLRHPPEGRTTGWFLWAGEEMSSAADYFAPLHVAHLAEWRFEVIPYLGLPPGYRFLIAPGYEDVWFDASLLDP